MKKIILLYCLCVLNIPLNAFHGPEEKIAFDKLVKTGLIIKLKGFINSPDRKKRLNELYAATIRITMHVAKKVFPNDNDVLLVEKLLWENMPDAIKVKSSEVVNGAFSYAIYDFNKFLNDIPARDIDTLKKAIERLNPYYIQIIKAIKDLKGSDEFPTTMTYENLKQFIHRKKYALKVQKILSDKKTNTDERKR